MLLRSRESYLESCKTLANLIAACTDRDLHYLMMKDFTSKRRHLEQQQSSEVDELLFAPQKSPGLINPMNASMVDPANRDRFDIAILTIKQPELIAAKLALGIDINAREDKYINGLRYWYTQIPTTSPEGTIRIILTMVGEAGNNPCAVACHRLFHAFEIGTCVLCGIAAGLKGKVSITDVVAATSILDYESGRLETDGFKKRPTAFPLDTAIQRDLSHFRPDSSDWHEHLGRCFTQLAEIEPVPTLPLAWRPRYHTGVIVAGEKLIADGSLPEMRDEYHEQVRAGEMEGSGFARSCKEFGIPWLVFRGISDYGDPNKPSTEPWQTTCALTAATSVVAYIKSAYRAPNVTL